MPDEEVTKSEMIDRVIYEDGWSVQVDMEELASGQRRYRIYVFAGEEDDLPATLDANSLHEALGEMYWFFRHHHDGEE